MNCRLEIRLKIKTRLSLLAVNHLSGGILANGQCKVGHFIHAKLNVPFESNAKVKWGILSNSPFLGNTCCDESDRENKPLKMSTFFRDFNIFLPNIDETTNS
jgi:hypothetical protein